MKAFKSLKFKTQNKIIGYIFLLPWIIGFVLLTLYPIIVSIRMSLSEVSFPVDGMKLRWRGLYYYKYAFNVDAAFKINLSQSLVFILGLLPVILVFSLIFALFLTQNFKGKAFFRAIFFMPVVIMSGPVISSLLENATVDFSKTIPGLYMVINSLPPAIANPCNFVLDNLDFVFWFLGVQMLIYLVGIQKIDSGLYEAASIDGAGSWEKFWKITLPNVLPYILLNAVYTVMELSNYPGNAVNMQILSARGDHTMLYSFSSAMSWVYLLCVTVVLLLIYLLFNWLIRRR